LESNKGLRIRKSLLQSSIPTFAALALFVVFAYGLDAFLHPSFSQTGLLLTGIVMALVPAAAWLVFFYQQDHHEPEPKGLVAQVFILGGLLAMAVAIPLVEDAFQVSRWIYTSFWVNLLGSILVIGFTQEFLKFAAVRFSVYLSSEFDERTDGIIYSTAAGLGFATILNIAYVFSSGGIDLGSGAIRIVLTALAQASISGVTGYFLSKEKLDGAPVWWLPLGVSIAAVLNGLFFTLYGALTKTKISAAGAIFNPWLGLVLAVVLAVLVTGLITFMIQKDQRHVAAKGG
jgi:RsiW-degrading membrane proteinase PrsW (M82 family)